MVPLFDTNFASSSWHLVIVAILFALIVLVIVGRWGPR